MPAIPKRQLLKTSMSRVFTTEDRAGPSHTPVYQQLTRNLGVTFPLGDITPVRVPNPNQYGSYIVVDKIKGQAGLPSSSLEVRSTLLLSEYLKLAKKGCSIDIQIHHGACKDPSDFDLGWSKIDVFEEVDFTNLGTGELGAFDADQEAPIMETVDWTAQDWYQIKPLNFTEQASSEIVQEVVDVVICDSVACGACGIPSNGCQRVFAVQVSAGASPGLPSEVISSQDGGATWEEQVITTLAANQAASAIACVGPYLVVVSNGDDSIHYASLVDLIQDDAVWTEVTTGIVGAGSPNRIFSFGRTKTWIVGDGGYIYFSEDITTGVVVQSAGTVSTQNLGAIDAINEDSLLVGGAANAILLTRNGGDTWAAVAGPSSQAAATVTGVKMLSENEWILTYSDGTVWYTVDGGVLWTQSTVPGSLTVIDDIKFSTRTVGYIAGHTATVGKILRTINGGKTWYVLPEEVGSSVPTAVRFNRLAACGDDVNTVFAGGLKTTPNGDGILIKGA